MEELDLNKKPGENLGGKKLEINNKKNSKLPLLILVFVGILAIALLSTFINDKRNTINLEECVMSPVFEGMNGEAKVAEITLDQAAIENRLKEISSDAYINYHDLVSRVSFSYDVNQTNIKNGDEILVTINYDKNELKNAFGYNFKGTEKTFIASGLFDYINTNPFEDLSFIFDGVAPLATIKDFTVSNDSFKSFRDGYTFKVNNQDYTRDSRLDIGDVISIELTESGVNKLKEMGLVPDKTSLSHTLTENDLDWYVREASEIKVEVLDKIISQAHDLCISDFANRGNDYTPSFEKAYFMVPKKEKFKDRVVPYVLLAYSYTDKNSETKYAAISSPSIISQKVESGKDKATSEQIFNVDNFGNVRYYNTIDDLFRDCIQKNVDDYTYEEISR